MMNWLIRGYPVPYGGFHLGVALWPFVQWEEMSLCLCGYVYFCVYVCVCMCVCVCVLNCVW